MSREVWRYDIDEAMKEDELQVPGQETAKEESEASSSNAPAADSETTSQDEEDEYSTSSGSDILDYYSMSPHTCHAQLYQVDPDYVCIQKAKFCVDCGKMTQKEVFHCDRPSLTRKMYMCIWTGERKELIGHSFLHQNQTKDPPADSSN